MPVPRKVSSFTDKWVIYYLHFTDSWFIAILSLINNRMVKDSNPTNSTRIYLHSYHSQSWNSRNFPRSKTAMQVQTVCIKSL
jgi:hypothetical protein